MTDEVPADVAERRYERWVMRAAELVWGDYPNDREEAERLLLGRMQHCFVESLKPSYFWGKGGSSLEEVGDGSSNYDENHVESARSLIFALYSAVGGDEWSLVVRPEKSGNARSVNVRGVSLDAEDVWIDLTVNPNSLACRDASDLRALHERIVRELPKGQRTVEEAANEGLVVVEEMQGILENVREVSDSLDTQQEMCHVRVALDNLWMVLAGIAAAEEDRRLRGEDGGGGAVKDALES